MRAGLLLCGPGLMAMAVVKAVKRSECHQMRAVDDLPPGFVALV